MVFFLVQYFLQRLVIEFLFVLLPIFGYVLQILLVLLFFTPLYMIPIYYLILFVTTMKHRHYGSLRIMWLRSLKMWKHVVNYFPMILHRIGNKKLDPNKNYIFVSQPHGICCAGIITLMNTEALHWSKYFAGIKPYVCSHEGLFYVPLVRELLLFFGHVGSNEEMFEKLFTSSTGNAVGLIVGGGRELTLSYPNKYRFVIKNRMGYAKIALKYGASLVPVITFGENSIYNVRLESRRFSFIRLLQDFCRKVMGTFFVFFYGRPSIFVPFFRMIPFARPIDIVVGEPLDVEKVVYPTKEQIVSLHESYKAKLRELFNREKYKYVENADHVHLAFVD